MLDETALRFEAAIVELHQRMDSGNLEGMDDLYKAIAGVEIQQNTLVRQCHISGRLCIRRRDLRERVRLTRCSTTEAAASCGDN
jgi:hypothetical protein